jgi:Effector protein
MKPALIGLAAFGLAVTALLVAQPTGERPIPGLRTVNRGDGAKEKDKDEDRDKEKRRVLRPRFTVSSSKEAYDLSERIILTLTLSLNKHFSPTDTEEESSGEEVEHRDTSKVTVETFEAETISVASATRNGNPIEPTDGATRYVDGPVGIQIRSLTTIGPGDHVTIPFDIPQSNEGSRLITAQPNPQSTTKITLIYSLAEPGWYRLQFRYHYTGPDDGKPNVFRGELLSNPVSFLLHRAEKDTTSVGQSDGIQCVGDASFVLDCEAALLDLSKTPTGAPIIQSLEQSDRTFTITETRSGTQTTAFAGAYDGKGSSAAIRWDQTDTLPFWEDGVRADPSASLLHELYHASIADKGAWSTEVIANTDLDEVDATMVENCYRRDVDLPQREKYNAADVPSCGGSPTPGPSSAR